MDRPKGIMLSEINHRKKQILYDLTYNWNEKKNPTHRKEIRFVVTRGRNREGGNWRRR